MNEPTEDQIKAVSTAPRITPADIENNIVAEYTFTADKAMGEGVPLMPELSLLTFCVLVLRNGFTVTGESACASPENFDAEIGRKIARANAVQKVWPLLGFALKEKLFQATLTPRPGANIHGLGPDVGGGPNPFYKVTG